MKCFVPGPLPPPPVTAARAGLEDAMTSGDWTTCAGDHGDGIHVRGTRDVPSDDRGVVEVTPAEASWQIPSGTSMPIPIAFGSRFPWTGHAAVRDRPRRGAQPSGRPSPVPGVPPAPVPVPAVVPPGERQL